MAGRETETMSNIFHRDGIAFHCYDAGDGVPFLYQHGLGGDMSQPLGFVRASSGIRVLSMDCRGHGYTRPLGDPEKIGMTALVDDLAAFLAWRGVSKAVVGGISMGAALALQLALRFPELVLGLVLQRPAWLDQPMPPHLRVLARIGELIRVYGAAEGAARFEASDEYAALRAASPDAAASALAQFRHPRAEETAIKLERIPRDAPCRDAAWRAIRVPALVLANRMDPVHPFEYGERLAAEMPGAELIEITPKSVSVEQHTHDVRTAIDRFLQSFT